MIEPASRMSSTPVSRSVSACCRAASSVVPPPPSPIPRWQCRSARPGTTYPSTSSTSLPAGSSGRSWRILPSTTQASRSSCSGPSSTGPRRCRTGNSLMEVRMAPRVVERVDGTEHGMVQRLLRMVSARPVAQRPGSFSGRRGASASLAGAEWGRSPRDQADRPAAHRRRTPNRRCRRRQRPSSRPRPARARPWRGSWTWTS